MNLDAEQLYFGPRISILRASYGTRDKPLASSTVQKHAAACQRLHQQSTPPSLDIHILPYAHTRLSRRSQYFSAIGRRKWTENSNQERKIHAKRRWDYARVKYARRDLTPSEVGVMARSVFLPRIRSIVAPPLLYATREGRWFEGRET